MLGSHPRMLLALIGAVLLAAPLPAVAVDDPGGQPGAGATPSQTRPSAQHLSQGWYARIETSRGNILARLHPEQAPQTVAHFAGLAGGTLPWTDVVTGQTRQDHYYDGIIVHRAVAGQQFEAGDPYGTGSGVPVMYLPPETDKPINFSQAWKLGMTRAPMGRISAVQFFITAASLPHLTHRHPCFGTVVQGKEVVYNITAVRTYSNGKPIEPVTIHRIRVFKVGNPPPLAEPVFHRPTGRKLEFRKKSPEKQ